MDRFTEEQIQEFKVAFVMIDRASIGNVPSDQLRDMLKIIGYNPTDDTLEKMKIVIDSDKDGCIDFNEFVDLIDKLETFEKNDIEARCAFNAFDFMGRGYIPARDIAEALKFVMENRSESDRDLVIKHYKLEMNRKIYFREFKDMMTVEKVRSVTGEGEKTIVNPDE